MTLQDRIEAGQCFVFKRLCREISEAGFPYEKHISRDDWRRLQREVNTREFGPIYSGRLMGVRLKVGK